MRKSPRNQTFEAFGEHAVLVLGAVGAGSGEVELLFVVEGFCGRAVQRPVGLPLVQLWGVLGDDNDDNEGGERRDDRGGNLKGGSPTLSIPDKVTGSWTPVLACPSSAWWEPGSWPG
jgi:hypothetical protein